MRPVGLAAAALLPPPWRRQRQQRQPPPPLLSVVVLLIPAFAPRCAALRRDAVRCHACSVLRSAAACSAPRPAHAPPCCLASSLASSNNARKRFTIFHAAAAAARSSPPPVRATQLAADILQIPLRRLDFDSFIHSFLRGPHAAAQGAAQPAPAARAGAGGAGGARARAVMVSKKAAVRVISTSAVGSRSRSQALVSPRSLCCLTPRVDRPTGGMGAGGDGAGSSAQHESEKKKSGRRSGRPSSMLIGGFWRKAQVRQSEPPLDVASGWWDYKSVFW